MADRTFLVNAEDYSKFLKCLDSLKDFCNDIDIQNGEIRQRNNDRATAFEVDLKSFLDGANLIISDMKKKLNLLSMFNGQDVTLEIHEGENGYYVVSDNYTSVKFLTPSKIFVDNQYITKEEMDKIFSVTDEDLIFSYEISQLVAERIKVTTNVFSTLTIQIIFNGDTASLSCQTQAKDQYAKFIDNIPLNMNMGNGFANVTKIPFKIDHDDKIIMKIYRDPNNQNIILHKFSTTLSGLSTNIYARSSLVLDDVDDDQREDE